MDISSIDPVVWKGVKSILVLIASIVFGLLGYKLYQEGRSRSRAEFKGETSLMQFVLSGTGPGLIFMGLGALMIFLSLNSDSSVPATSLKDTGVTMESLQRTLEEQERLIAGLERQLSYGGTPLRRTVAQSLSSANSDSEIAIVIDTQIVAYMTDFEERMTIGLNEVFDEQEEQTMLMNSILEDHENRIGELEFPFLEDEFDAILPVP